MALFGKKNGRYKTGLSGKRGVYNSWLNMKARCLNQNHPKYPRYGGRGITIHPDWLDSAGFVAWANASGWMEGLTIDRIDNDGNYCPENCRWISASANSRRKSTTRITLEQAKTIRERLDGGENAHELAGEYGVVHGTIWFIEKYFTHVDEGICSVALECRDFHKKAV